MCGLDFHSLYVVDVELVDFSFDEYSNSKSLVSNNHFVPGIEVSEYYVDFGVKLKMVGGDLSLEVESHVLDKEIEINLPLELNLSEEDIVMNGDIINLDVVVVDDFGSFNLKSVSPEDVEFFNLDVVFEDDSGFSINKDANVVGFD